MNVVLSSSADLPKYDFGSFIQNYFAPYMETELISAAHIGWADILGLSWFFIGGE